MNPKLVVALMSILGLVTCPVLAATNNQPPKPASHPQQPHRMTHASLSRHATNMPHEYHASGPVEEEDMGPMDGPPPPIPPQGAPMEACIISQNTMIMDQMTQNMRRAMPTPCNPAWFERIRVSGGINVDFGKWWKRGNIMGENYQRVSLNDAYVNIGAEVNEWVNVFASLSFNTATTVDPTIVINNPGIHVSEFDAAYSNNITSGSDHNVQLEQAFATIGNFNQSPVFIQFGKQFQDFGRYEIHPITESLTQVMSKTLATSLKLGFIANGFNGSIYVFDNPIPKNGQTRTLTNYGASLGYDYPNDDLGWDAGIGWLYDLNGVNDIAYSVNQYNLNRTVIFNNQYYGDKGGYHRRVNGLAVYADVNSGPVIVSARFVTALNHFSSYDLPLTTPYLPYYYYSQNILGAKPWSIGAQLAYGFTMFGWNQSAYIGYQSSGEAGALGLARNRVLLGYNVTVWNNAGVGFEWDHDNPYGKTLGGTGKTTNLISFRLSAQFA